jgi:mono/diheme cytochrome c family protein
VPLSKPSPYIRNHAAIAELNLDWESMGDFDIRPSPLLTKSLYFLGASGNLSGGTGSAAFRAYDKSNGKVIWEMDMPSLVTGAPMTYELNGRQYVVMAVSARDKPAEIVALTLDGVSENGASLAGGVALAAAPPSTRAAALAISATPQELALGREKFDGMCAICHGPDGKGLDGGNAPPLTERTDYANIARVIAQGQGEMPALSNAMSPVEIEAVAKYVVKTLGPQPRALNNQGRPVAPADDD